MCEHAEIFTELLRVAEKLGKVESAHFYGRLLTIEGSGAAGHFDLTLTLEAEHG